MTVLNGNGVTGSASNASYLLGQRGYQILTAAERHPGERALVRLLPHRRVLRSRRRRARRRRRRKVANLFGSADVKRTTARSSRSRTAPCSPSVVGQTFHGSLASAPIDQTPKRELANVVPGAGASLDLLRERQKKVDFPLMVPTVIERCSWIDRERPVHLYRLDEKDRHKTMRLTYKMGSNEYWGVQQTDWEDAPVLGGRNFVRNIGGRRYELYYNGPHLHMVVLRTDEGTYWVVNTLLDRLSNETMLAIAKGLRPVSKVRS